MRNVNRHVILLFALGKDSFCSGVSQLFFQDLLFLFRSQSWRVVPLIRLAVLALRLAQVRRQKGGNLFDIVFQNRHRRKHVIKCPCDFSFRRGELAILMGTSFPTKTLLETRGNDLYIQICFSLVQRKRYCNIVSFVGDEVLF